MFDTVLMVLVLRLDAPVFRDREHAHAAINRVGVLAIPALEWGNKHCGAEGRRRCVKLIERWEWQRAYNAAGKYPQPWVNAQVLTAGGTWEPPVIQGWEAYISQAAKRGFKCVGPDYPNYREATRLWVASQIIQRRSDREIRAVLSMLANQEGHYRKMYP